LEAELKRKDEVIEALFQQIDALTDRIASAEAAICRLQGQKRVMFQAIRKRQQVIEDQALHIRELQAALDKREARYVASRSPRRG
jgi:peptidoglycan hydrolase CwlO-like protein